MTPSAINVTTQVHPRGLSGSKLGPALASAALLVLSTEGRTPLPFGEEGELAITGPQLARGYLGKPELTAQQFVEVEGVGRVYRTGDRARIEDGGVTYLGRIDNTQVKINGKRVEFGEASHEQQLLAD
jgi:ferricrocin synthase